MKINNTFRKYEWAVLINELHKRGLWVCTCNEINWINTESICECGKKYNKKTVAKKMKVL